MRLRGLTSRIGNKWNMRKMIYPLIPDNFETYIEPFVGSGSIYFGLEQEMKNKKVVLNDLDQELMRIYILVEKGVIIVPVDSYETIQQLDRLTPQTEIEELRNRMIKTCYTIGRRTNIHSIHTHPHIRSIGRYNYRANNLTRYREMLENATLLSQDYIEVVEKYDDENAFFYLDPPYESSSHQHYKNVGVDYEKMAEILKSVKGRFLLSMNDSSSVRSYFSCFTINNFELNFPLGNKKPQKRKELLIYNY